MKYIVDGKDLKAIANHIRNLYSISDSLTITDMVEKLKELDDTYSTQRTYKITFNPISCTAIGCHNSGISCAGWDLTEYNKALADATAFINAEGYSGEALNWSIPSSNHVFGSCIGDICSGDDKCGECHGGTAATPCSPITVIYTATRSELALINFTIEGISYKAQSGMTWLQWCASSYNTGGYFINLDTDNVNNANNQIINIVDEEGASIGFAKATDYIYENSICVTAGADK